MRRLQHQTQNTEFIILKFVTHSVLQTEIGSCWVRCKTRLANQNLLRYKSRPRCRSWLRNWRATSAYKCRFFLSALADALQRKSDTTVKFLTLCLYKITRSTNRNVQAFQCMRSSLRKWLNGSLHMRTYPATISKLFHLTMKSHRSFTFQKQQRTHAHTLCPCKRN